MLFPYFKAQKVDRSRSITIFKTKPLRASIRRVTARHTTWSERNRYRESMNALNIDRTISDMDNDLVNTSLGEILQRTPSTFLVPSLKKTAQMFLEILLIECCTVLVEPSMTSSLSSFA